MGAQLIGLPYLAADVDNSGEINILRYDTIRNMCINFAHLEEPGHPTLADLNEVSDLTGRTAYYEMQRLDPLFNECYIPTLRKIGLRYRYIFTPRQRPGIFSDGLIERMILIEQDIRGCTIHIEPNWSRGPDPRPCRQAPSMGGYQQESCARP